MPRDDAARGEPDRVCDRQPEREEYRERRRNVDPNGYDAGKKIKGKKRHILVDTVGLVLHAIVHPADIQERDGGILLISTLFGRFPFLRKMFADGGYQGPQFEQAIACVFPQLDIEIVKRSDAAGGFKVLPRDGSSNGRSLGSTAAAACARISRI